MAASLPTELSWYLEHIRADELLTPEEEVQLARRVREHGDVIAREQMIHANLRLVVKVARSYMGKGMSLGDLVAEGNLGLIRAVEQFDADAGTRFSTYAVWWIKQAIKQALHNAGHPIHVPEYLSKLIGQWRRMAAKMEAELGRAPEPREVAAAMDLSDNKLEIVLEGLRAVNTPAQIDGDDGEGLGETLNSPAEAAPDQGLMEASNAPFVQSLLAKLPAREKEILELRFNLDGHEGEPRTYREIGKAVGLTRERVRQLEKVALKKLRDLSEQDQ